MVKRLFWMTVGAGLAVYGMKRAERFARAWTPEGVADRVEHSFSDLGDTLRGIAADVRVGMAEREDELRPAVEPGPREPETTDNDHVKDGS